MLIPKINVRGFYCDARGIVRLFARRNYNRTQGEMIAAMDQAVENAVLDGATSASVVLGNPFGSTLKRAFSLAQRMELLDLMMAKGQSRFR